MIYNKTRLKLPMGITASRSQSETSIDVRTDYSTENIIIPQNDNITDSDDQMNSFNDDISKNFINNKCIGSGSFGKIYALSDTHIAKIFDNDNISTMIVESHVLYTLRQSINISQISCSIFSNEICRKQYCIIMQKYDTTLSHLISTKLFDKKQLKHCIKSIVNALAFAQSNNILHRDIKPDNIFINIVDEKYHVVVGDWGLSMIKYSDHVQSDDFVAQALWYRAPEGLLIINDKLNNDTIDMWSLGMIIFEILYPDNNPFIKLKNKIDVLINYISIFGFPKNKYIVDELDNKYRITKNTYIEKQSINFIFDFDKSLYFFFKKITMWCSDDRYDPQTALSGNYLSEFKYKPNKSFKSFDINQNINYKYQKYRKKYYDAYEKIISRYGMTNHELFLMMIYTDNIMIMTNINKQTCATLNKIITKGKFNSYLCVAVANIISSINSIRILEIQYVHEIFEEIQSNVTIIIIMRQIMENMNLPLVTNTFYSLINSFNDQHVQKFYEMIAKKIIKNYDYNNFSPIETFGSIVNFMCNYYYEYNNDKIFLKNVLNDLSLKYFPKFNITFNVIFDNILIDNYIFRLIHE